MSQPVYRWSAGSAVKGLKAQLVGEHFEALRIKHNGHLSPEIVLRDAQSKRSPIHKFFEWIDGKAATHHRLEQARYLIRHIVVTVKSMPVTKKRPTRAFVNVTKDKVRSFTSITTAMSDKDMRAQVLSKALAELLAWRDRYAHLKELAKVFAAIEKVEDLA